MKLSTLHSFIKRSKFLFVFLGIATALINLTGCDGTSGLVGGLAGGIGIAAIFGGTGGPAAAGIVVAAGGEVQKPALLLPFTAEVAALAISPDGETLFASDRFHNTVSVIDIRAGNRLTVAVLDAGTGPRNIAITPKDGKLLLVPNFGTGTQDLNFSNDLSESLFSDGKPGSTVKIINTDSFETVEDLEVGRRPLAISIMPDDSKAYIANYESENLSVIDLTTFTAGFVRLSGDLDGAISREIIPVAIAITDDGSRVLIVSSPIDSTENAIVDIVDTALDEIIASIEVGPSGDPPHHGIAIHPNDTIAYVTNPGDDSFSIIDLSDIDNLPGQAEKVAFSNGPAVAPGSLVFSIDGTRAYVAFPPAGNTLCPANSPGELAIINSENNIVLQNGIEVGEAAIGLVITDDGSKVYTISGCEDPTTLEGKVTRVVTTDDEILANDILTIVNVRNRATAVAIGLGSEEVFVALPDAVAIIDTETDTVVNEGIPVRGSGPTKLEIIDVNNGTRLFSVHPSVDSVSVTELNGNGGTFLGSVPVGSRPASLAIEADQVIVGNAGYSRTPDNRISIFDANIILPTTGAGVDEVELPVEVPNDINDDAYGIGRGPVDLKIVDIPNIGPSAITANFGDFFPNTRRPGGSISQIQDINITRQVDRIDLFINDAWPIEITPPFITQTSQFVYILDFRLETQGSIFPFEIGTNNTNTAKFTDNLPASSEILDNDLYVANYLSENQTITIDRFDLANTPDSPDGLDAIQIDFATNSSPATNPGKLKIMRNKKIAFVLHGGDRSFICDDDVFCEIGSVISVISLADPPVDPQNPNPKAFVTVGKRPTDIAFSSDETKVFVTNYFDGTVSIIETDNIDFNNLEKAADKTLAVGAGPSGVLVRDAKVYVANSISNSISVIPIEPTVADINQDSIQTIPLN